jgi:tetratricopeptide (TPR) repeat protein
MAEAHAAMGMVSDRYYDDLDAATEHYETALRLNPNLSWAYDIYGDTVRDLGDIPRMVELRRKAVEIDPLSVFRRARLVGSLTLSGQFEEGREILDQMLAENPDDDYAREELGNWFMIQGYFADAVQQFKLVHLARPGDPFSAAWISRLYGIMGAEDMADRWIAEARARGADNRWEIFARSMLLERRADYSALEKLGLILSGSDGATIRGWAFYNQGKDAEARQSFINALQLSGYRVGDRIIADIIDPLLGRAAAEQALGLESEPGLAERLRDFLDAESSAQMTAVVQTNSHFRRAMLETLKGERSAALTSLQAAVDSGFAEHWFLDNFALFKKYRNDADFRRIVEGIRSHAADELARLAEMEARP